MEFHEKLVCLRKKQGLTQQELAEAVDVSRQAVSKWEVGTATPSIKNLRSLSALYGVSLDELIGSGETEECGAACAPASIHKESEVTKAPHMKKPTMPHIVSLVLLLMVIVLQAMPYGVSSQYLYSDGEAFLSANMPKYSYFDMTPFLHGNFPPFISAIACVAAANTLFLTLLSENKSARFQPLITVSVLLSAAASVLTLLVCKTPLSGIITGILTGVLILRLSLRRDGD